jgi:hypothetical protein
MTKKRETAEEYNDNNDDGDWDILLQKVDNGDQSSMTDLELALARAEDLTARRPILLNRVLLRRNPDDVGDIMTCEH